MLDGENLIAHVAFQTFHGANPGEANLGDLPTRPGGNPPPGPAFASRALRCLVQNSQQEGSTPIAVGAGRYSCILGGGNEDINPADLDISWNVTNGIPGGGGAAFLKITRTGPAVFEIDIYALVAGVPTLSDTVPGSNPAEPWQVNVTWRRVELA